MALGLIIDQYSFRRILVEEWLAYFVKMFCDRTQEWSSIDYTGNAAAVRILSFL